MKKIFLTIAIAVFTCCSYAQPNTFPSSGSVGIGTTSPLTQLDVRLATNQHVQFISNVNGGYSGASGIVCINDGNTGYTPLGFFASNYYFGGGHVGIGTSTPSAFLHILGTTEQLQLGYDATDYAKFTVSSTGALTITPTGTAISTTITGGVVLGNTSSNLYLPAIDGAAAASTAQYQFAGSANTYFRAGLGGSSSTSLATGYNYSGLNVAGSPFTLGTSINIPFAASAVINPISAITIGSGSSVTNTATLYLDGANTQGTNNYALYSSAGLNYFGGTVGINTSYVPSNFLFAINGNMIATGVTVQQKTNWPDYVFQRKYHLPSLSYIKEYIHDNSHLPGFPSANDIKTKGIDLGEINVLLTKKVEELTLYVIDKDEQLKNDEIKIKGDEDKLKAQEERLSNLESAMQTLLKKGN